jgi:hypothetical protein
VLTSTPWQTVATIAYALGWVIIVAALFVVPRNRKPGSATAWLMLVLLFPFVGLFLYWLIGSPKLSRRRRAQQRRMDAMLAREAAWRDASPDRVFDAPIRSRSATSRSSDSRRTSAGSPRAPATACRSSPTTTTRCGR